MPTVRGLQREALRAAQRFDIGRWQPSHGESARVLDQPRRRLPCYSSWFFGMSQSSSQSLITGQRTSPRFICRALKDEHTIVTASGNGKIGFISADDIADLASTR